MIRRDMFPDQISATGREPHPQAMGGYLTDSTATLNAASPAAFTPSLTSLDALVRSITFDERPRRATDAVRLTGSVTVPSAAS